MYSTAGSWGWVGGGLMSTHGMHVPLSYHVHHLKWSFVRYCHYLISCSAWNHSQVTIHIYDMTTTNTAFWEKIVNAYFISKLFVPLTPMHHLMDRGCFASLGTYQSTILCFSRLCHWTIVLFMVDIGLYSKWKDKMLCKGVQLTATFTCCNFFRLPESLGPFRMALRNTTFSVCILLSTHKYT